MMKGKRIIISGLISANLDAEAYIAARRERIEKAGGIVLGECVQRRGVSRSRKPGGALMMDQALDTRMLLGKGKLKALSAMVAEQAADLIVIIHPLSPKHQRNLQSELGVEVVEMI